jgi:hypothetical protein
VSVVSVLVVRCRVRGVFGGCCAIRAAGGGGAIRASGAGHEITGSSKQGTQGDGKHSVYVELSCVCLSMLAPLSWADPMI